MNAPLNQLPPGLHADIPMEQYLADDALSAGTCHTLLTYSPLHAKHAREHRGDNNSTPADIGTCAHSMLLEGNANGIAVIDPKDYPAEKTGAIPDGWTNKAIRAARDEAYAAGKTPILKARMVEVVSMVDAALEFIGYSELPGIFQRGRPELTMVWREGKLRCRARPDWLADEQDVILHYKTTSGSAQPDAWIRNQLVPCGYDVAAAFYERGLYEMPGGEERSSPTSVFLVQETAPPYCCSLVGLSPALLELAERKVERAIGIWTQCVASGRWPAYPSRICYAEPKPWQLAEAEEHHAADVDAAYDQLQMRHGVQA